MQRAVAEANVGEGHGLCADRGDRPGRGAELLEGRDITGFARLHFEPLAVGQLALPGGIAEVAESHQRGIRGVGDEDRQGVIEAFTRRPSK